MSVESQLLQFIIVGYVAAITGVYRLAGVDMTLIVGGAALFVAGSATTLPFLFSLG